MAGRAVRRARCDSDHIAFPLLFHQRVLIKRLRGTDRHGGTIPPRAELLTSNASVVFTGVSALANLNVVIEQHLKDLSAIDVRANEPKLPCLLKCKSCAAAPDDHSSHEFRSRRRQCRRSKCVSMAQWVRVHNIHVRQTYWKSI
jgi:hypothetical protein